VTTVFDRFPFLELRPFFPAGSCRSLPRRSVISPLESGLQQPLRQLLEQTALNRSLAGPRPERDNDLVQEPVIHSRRRGPRFGRLGYVLAGHRCTVP
jgi:hypothetical protein